MKMFQQNNLRFALPLLLLMGCVSLLQWHSIQFWTRQVDSDTGWAWSILLELAGLWLWYQSSRLYRLLAVIASVLLLVGPLYVVSEPLVVRLVNNQVNIQNARAAAKAMERARAESVPVLEASIASLERQLAVFLDNSTERSGWLPAIERVQTELAEQRRALADWYRLPVAGAETTTSEPMPLPPWTQSAVIVMQCLALLLYQLTGILAVRHLAAPIRDASLKEPDPPADPDSVSLGSLAFDRDETPDSPFLFSEYRRDRPVELFLS